MKGTTPHFSEKPRASSKTRTSVLAAQRYANVQDKKDSKKQEDPDDSDYDRVELQLFSERAKGRCEGSEIQRQTQDFTAFLPQHGIKAREESPDQAEEPRQNVPQLSESSDMHPQEFMNSEIDKVSEMDQFRNSVASLEEQKTVNPFKVEAAPKKSAFKFLERAIPLVTFNQSKQSKSLSFDFADFVVNPEVVQMMESVKGPLGVISVAGMYRTGKSYLLNRVLLNRQRGFGVGPTINPCTKGIWVWGTPLSGTNANGEPISVIIVDSEGLGGIDEDNNHDMRIFSLAMLMSSYFVYNSVGQIDENAISNLSLVINLTKHIQLSVSKERDPGLETVMPAFMWVVRDFALQLEDEDGAEISQSDYLEKALQLQSSDPKDQKTQIRKCLIKYFPRRDCHTLVRPLVDEELLQKLEEMEIDQLRPEFVEQVVNLRKKILNACPVKTVYGHAMDGETWVNMLTQYVNAINTGTVPNIESAWTQICRSKAQQALSQIVDQFEKEVSELASPISQTEFEKNLRDAERTAIKDLSKEMTIDSALVPEYIQKLKSHLKKRVKDLIAHNHQVTQEFAQQMLATLFTELEQIKQTCQEDPCSNSFQQVEYALREVTNYYDANCCDFAEKHFFLAEAKLAFMFDILSIQSHHAINQGRLQQQVEVEIKEKLTNQLRQVKEDARNEQIRLEQQWKQALIHKSELEASSQIVTEQLKSIKELKLREDAEHSEIVTKLKKQVQELKDDFNQKKELATEQAKELTRSQKQAQSEYEKEKALMKQKIEYLEKTLTEKANKEKEYAVDWRTQKSGLTQEIKAITAKHEAEMKNLISQIDEEKDHSSELESKLAEKSQKIEYLSERLVDIEATLKQQLLDANTTIKDLQNSRNQIKQETTNQLSAKLMQSTLENQLQKAIAEELEKKLRESQEQHQQSIHETKKQVAMRDQKIEFLTLQIKEVKEQLEESQRQHATMVAALDQRGQNSEDEDAREKIDLLQKELTSTSQQYSKQVKDLQGEIAVQKQQLVQLDMLAKQKLFEAETTVTEAQESLKESEYQRQTLLDKIRAHETNIARLTDELKSKETQFKQRLEQEIQDREDAFQNELRDAQSRHDEQTVQLKQFYEHEKEKIELRVTEEKERSQRRLATYQEEQENRLREECRDKDSEIEFMQQQLSELEQHQASFQTQAEHEISLKQMQIDGLERSNIDLKDRLNKLESTRNNAFDKQLEHFEQQRQELNQKVERFMQENLAKDKQIAQLTHQMERSNETFEKREAEYSGSMAMLERERSMLFERCEQQKTALSELQDDAMQNKLESGREIALLNQQVEFLNHKIDDLQRSNEENQRTFEDKIKAIRQEISEDSQAQIDRVTQEKELWEQKYEQKRKSLKEIEMQLGRKISDLEKQTSVQQSAIQKQAVEHQNRERELVEEVSRLQAQMSSEVVVGDGQLFGSVSTEDLFAMKNQLTETERELSDLQSNYDRDKALWEGKVQFLESQKDNYKKDLIEAQRKFEITLDQLQKRGNQNKERQENSQQAIMKVLEQKYKEQIKELIEQQQVTASDQKERIKRLEAELLQANERAATKTRSDEVSLLEKRLAEIKQNESRLQLAYSDLQTSTHRRIEELQGQLVADRDGFKAKLAEAEKKSKDAETKRSQLLFSIEKERANWQLEEDHLRRKQAELEEFIQNLEKSKDSLKKENSKLRNDVRGNSAVGQKKSFVFQKGQLGMTQLSTTALPPKAKPMQDAFSAETQHSTNGISSGSQLQAALAKKENQMEGPYADLKHSPIESKQRQMASPDVLQRQKSPLIVNRVGQSKPLLKQPLISGSLSSYNVATDSLSNNGSAIGQGFKLNLPNRYRSDENQ